MTEHWQGVRNRDYIMVTDRLEYHATALSISTLIIVQDGDRRLALVPVYVKSSGIPISLTLMKDTSRISSP